MTAATKTSAPDFAAARFHMVESQIKPNKVTDERILKIIGSLPREMFVPPNMAGIAYIDEDLQVAPGRCLLEPMVFARLLQEADIKAGDRVLDIASGTGYSTAVLAGLAGEVAAVESDPMLRKKLEDNLTTLQIKNAEVNLGPLVGGWEETAPYDIILINGCVELVPEALTAQLVEGGRLVAVIRTYTPGAAFHTGEARLYQKIHGRISYRTLFDANVSLLPGFEKPKKFVL